MKDGKKCDGLMDVSCICKNGRCKISCKKLLLYTTIIICTPKLVVGPWELSSSLIVPPVQRRIARMRGHAGG